MDTGLSRALTNLAKGELLRIGAGRGKGIAVFRGQAWITQQNDLRDVVLDAGESFVLDRSGTAIVQALADTSVLVFEPDARAVVERAVRAADVAPRVDATPSVADRSWVDVYFEARRERAAMIGDALLSLFTLPRLWARAWLRD
jgi:Protein of unknown function (DUF2917)